MDILKENEQCPTCGRYANRGVSIDAVIIKNDQILLIQRGVLVEESGGQIVSLEIV